MSSISSSSRTRSEEKLRQAREEYEAREAENFKKQTSELKRLEARNLEDRKNLSDEYDRRLNVLNKRNREIMSEKDYDNNKKIDEVRQAYRDSLKNKVEETNIQKDIQKATFDSELKKQKDIARVQRDNLTSHFKDDLTSYDSRFEKDLLDNRKQHKSDIRTNMRKLREAHMRERNSLVTSQEEELLREKHNSHEMRKSFESQIQEGKRARSAENASWMQKLQDTIDNERDKYAEDLQVKQEILDSERNVIRDKFDNVLSKKINDMEKNSQQFKDTVSERMKSQISARDGKIQSLNNKLKNEMAKGERLRGVERKELISDYEKRLDLMEDQHSEELVHLKEIVQKRIDAVNQRSQDVLHRSDIVHKGRMNQEKTSRGQERENLMQQHKDLVSQVANSSESRVKKIIDSTNKNNKKLERYYNESLEQMGANYNEHIDRQIEKSAMDRVALNKVMTERFRGIENNYTNKLEQTIGAYEEKIEKIKEAQQDEIKKVEKKFSQRLEEKDKLVKLEKQTLEMKYEAKLAQLNESHDDQLDRMNRRHKEDMQNLTAKISTYSRKA